MPAAPELTADIDKTLSRYLEIQQEEQRLREEKAELQRILSDHLEPSEQSEWCPEVAGQRLKIRFTAKTIVEYDEALLRERLGDRYLNILEPDPKKIRRHLDEITPQLTAVLPLIGTPGRERVRAAITGGQVRAEEFKGAFTKTTKRYITVGRVPKAAQPQAE